MPKPSQANPRSNWTEQDLPVPSFIVIVYENIVDIDIGDLGKNISR